jgi:hypothetical protein
MLLPGHATPASFSFGDSDAMRCAIRPTPSQTAASDAEDLRGARRRTYETEPRFEDFAFSDVRNSIATGKTNTQ